MNSGELGGNGLTRICDLNAAVRTIGIDTPLARQYENLLRLGYRFPQPQEGDFHYPSALVDVPSIATSGTAVHGTGLIRRPRPSGTAHLSVVLFPCRSWLGGAIPEL